MDFPQRLPERSLFFCAQSDTFPRRPACRGSPYSTLEQPVTDKPAQVFDNSQGPEPSLPPYRDGIPPVEAAFLAASFFFAYRRGAPARSATTAAAAASAPNVETDAP